MRTPAECLESVRLWERMTDEEMRNARRALERAAELRRFADDARHELAQAIAEREKGARHDQ